MRTSRITVMSAVGQVTIGDGNLRAVRVEKVIVTRSMSGDLNITGFHPGDRDKLIFTTGFVGTLNFDGAVSDVVPCTVEITNTNEIGRVFVIWSHEGQT